jgi:hypothetical protein
MRMYVRPCLRASVLAHPWASHDDLHICVYTYINTCIFPQRIIGNVVDQMCVTPNEDAPAEDEGQEPPGVCLSTYMLTYIRICKDLPKCTSMYICTNIHTQTFSCKAASLHAYNTRTHSCFVALAVAGLHASMRIEETLLRNRLSAIEVRVTAMVEDLRGREKKLLERMDDMLGERSVHVSCLNVCVCVCVLVCARICVRM